LQGAEHERGGQAFHARDGADQADALAEYFGPVADALEAEPLQVRLVHGDGPGFAELRPQLRRQRPGGADGVVFESGADDGAEFGAAVRLVQHQEGEQETLGADDFRFLGDAGVPALRDRPAEVHA